MLMCNDCSKPLSESLSANQQAALDAIIDGKSFKDAAAAAGVNRTTLYRWIQSDPAFRADYLPWQEMAGEEARARLVAKAAASVDAVIERMEEDSRFAFKVIKDMGLLKLQPAGLKEVDPVRREIELPATERMGAGRGTSDVNAASGVKAQNSLARNEEPVKPAFVQSTAGQGMRNDVAAVGLEKRPDPAVSATLGGYLTQLTEAAARNAVATAGKT